MEGRQKKVLEDLKGNHLKVDSEVIAQKVGQLCGEDRSRLKGSFWRVGTSQRVLPGKWGGQQGIVDIFWGLSVGRGKFS